MERAGWVFPGNPSLKDSEGVTLVLGVTDLHYGAYAWSQQSGERWNREVCRERLTTAIDSALSRTTRQLPSRLPSLTRTIS